MNELFILLGALYYFNLHVLVIMEGHIMYKALAGTWLFFFSA